MWPTFLTAGLGVLIGSGLTALLMSRPANSRPDDLDNSAVEFLAVRIEANRSRLEELIARVATSPQEVSNAVRQPVSDQGVAVGERSDSALGSEVAAAIAELGQQIASIQAHLGARADDIAQAARVPTDRGAVQRAYDALAATNQNGATAERWALLRLPELMAEFGRPDHISESEGRIQSALYRLDDDPTGRRWIRFMFGDGMVTSVTRK